MNDNVNDIKEVMTRFLAGEASPAEERVLSEWLKSSEDNAREFEKTKRLFNAATAHYRKTSTPEINVDEEWSIFLNKVADRTPVRELPSASSPNWWLRIAASLLLLLSVSAIVYFYANRTESFSIESSASIRQITLPDGSTVVLNRKSRLDYDDEFGKKNRNLSLRGEAFFDVKRNESIPFIIKARNTTIEVLGTSFNVLAYDSLEKVQVVVKTGTVRFGVIGLEKSVELTAGEKGNFQASGETLTELPNDDVNYQSWNTRDLSFVETPLDKVIASINKAYNANIILTGPVSDTCVLTASFSGQSLDAVLNVLENTLNITVTRVGNRIEIVSAGC